MINQTLQVLMPVYNCASYVAQAIDSVLAQTHRDFELHIFNDGSTDNTLEICREYEKKDARVRLFSHENIGIANTMNLALAQLTSEWVYCMHGDDVMLPNRLERQLKFIEANPDLAVVSGLARLIDQSGGDVGLSKSPFVTRDAVTAAVTRGQCVAFNHPMCALRREVILAVGGYRQEFWPAEDTDLWNRVLAAGHGVLVQEECLLKYRIHTQAASTKQARLMVQKLAWVCHCIDQRRAGKPELTWDQFLDERKSAPLRTRWNNGRKEIARTLYQSSLQYLASRQYAGLVSSLSIAMMLEPSLVLPRVLPRLLAR